MTAFLQGSFTDVIADYHFYTCYKYSHNGSPFSDFCYRYVLSPFLFFSPDFLFHAMSTLRMTLYSWSNTFSKTAPDFLPGQFSLFFIMTFAIIIFSVHHVHQVHSVPGFLQRLDVRSEAGLCRSSRSGNRSPRGTQSCGAVSLDGFTVGCLYQTLMYHSAG